MGLLASEEGICSIESGSGCFRSAAHGNLSPLSPNRDTALLTFRRANVVSVVACGIRFMVLYVREFVSKTTRIVDRFSGIIPY